ncbi:hypothetical protein CY34DRAFT_17433 [Suillus luteus UH-Slu-Lm8-n1]|uniref:Uncharacterized protein n=1 Tax=Suillus luteus UH-Slu-Lm8-n1 TaxID=930992 RepID=A0A0D0AKQ7_9AGAM|nr:hypothetical protein CY34DRAFT_17433 [Suillus luteus UH-Slu-Lm8-n1]
MARGLSCAQSESSLTDSQHPFDSEQQQINQNHDVEMGNSFGGMIESDHRDSEEAVLPMGRIPGCLVDIEPSRDDLNHSNGADIPSNQTVSQIPAQTRIRRVLLTLRDTLQTTFNSFGLCRHYPRRPSFEPDQLISSSLLSRTAPTPGTDSDSPQVLAPPYPFPNMTIYRLLSWMNSGSNMVSESKVSQLVRDVLLAEEYDPKHLENFSTDVTISIPTKSKDDGPQCYTIPRFHFQPLLEVIRAAFADAQARAFHLFPFQRLWKDPLDGHQERIYDEMYTSDAWLEAQDSIQRLPKEPGSNFGTAKAWPLYLYFGNLTKYARSSPQSGECHLVGFLPSLPDRVKDVLSKLSGISKTGMVSLHAHCRRELFHSCWEILLDEDFVVVYQHGIVLRCADGVMRRVFPRIFTYSADYPEKVLIATIKDMGLCPCPRCLTPKRLFNVLGLARDMRRRITNLRAYVMTNVIKAREFIYTSGNTVDGAKVDHTLGEGSWNQFVQKLAPLGLDPFRMLVVDFMHKCELGTWKGLFTHLIRLLYALPRGSELVAALDSRFRQVPTFGNGVIRKFSNNTSEMKRLAARDFEDILQCAIPVFEGLFPDDHDVVVQSLLYQFAQWHALAKLRLHSESTLSFFAQSFQKLSRGLRKFQNYTCAAFNCVELPREKAAHQKKSNQRSETNATSTESRASMPRTKKFHLGTYKFHAMGDYVRTIKFFGTTDSFTTQIGELAHKALKAFYPLTSKLDTPAQLAKHERRRRVLRRAAEGGVSSSSNQSAANAPPSISFEMHHYIAPTRNNAVNIFAFLREHDRDPAIKNFVPKLRDHILYRLRELDISYCDHTFTDEERNSVIIPNNTIYSVHTMQVHYTTYDLRREYDIINPKTHGDVMVLSGEAKPSHPYWYARVLGIFHMEVWLQNRDGGQPAKRHLEVLWLAFVEETDQDAFGFLNPGQVIRGTHLIPAFASGRGVSSLRHGKSLARPDGETDDWEEHYVGIFVDRDMYMRYTYFGIGHSPMLRRITRDCLIESARQSDAMDTADGDNVEDAEQDEVGDDHPYNEGDDGQDDGDDEGCENSDNEFSGEELNEDDGSEDDSQADSEDDEFDHVSF